LHDVLVFLWYFKDLVQDSFGRIFHTKMRIRSTFSHPNLHDCSSSGERKGLLYISKNIAVQTTSGPKDKKTNTHTHTHTHTDILK